MYQTLDMMQVKLLQFAKCTFSLLVIAGFASSNAPDSPCPKLFQYKFDGSDWIGLIELKHIKVNQTVVNIVVKLSLPWSDKLLYKGHLDLLQEQQQAAQAILESRPVLYKINFPLRSPIPFVKEIVVDNEVVCSGTPDDENQQTTRFQLHHVFYPKRAGHPDPSIIEETSNDRRPCELTDGTEGVCTIINKCKAVYKGVIKYEELAKNRCGFVDGTDFVCCKDPDPPTGRRADEACAKYTSADVRRSDKMYAFVGEFPHMALLGHSSFIHVEDYVWNCPASLISDQYLLTSAHCIRRHPPDTARIGHDFIRAWNILPPRDYLIDDLIIHPNYVKERLYNDIALVRLQQKVKFYEFVRPACLNTNQTRLPPDTNFLLLQYQKNSYRDPRTFGLFKKYLKIAEFSSCNQSYANIRGLPNGLTEGQMCAFDPQLIEECEQDFDGLLQIVDNIGKPTIYGVTNFIGGCVFSLPGIYTRFSKYIDWIESIVWPYTPT